MLSVSTVVFEGHDMAAGFDVLATLGFDAVEPAFIKGYIDFDEQAFSPKAATVMAKMLQASGLKAAALSAHIDLGDPDSADKLLRRADFAACIGAGIVITNSSTIDKEAAFAATLGRCLPEFSARNIVLALENPGHGSGSLIPNGKKGAKLVRSFDHQALRLNYDVGNAMTYCQMDYSDSGASALEDLAAALPWCARLHLKDIASNGPNWDFCTLGDGDVDYRQLLNWLFMIETLPDFGLELPLRLTRPLRGDPIRKLNPVPLMAAQTAIERSTAFFNAHRMQATGLIF